MSESADRLARALLLKDRLPRTWSVFFGRHGNFTAVQLAAMPALLDGANMIVCAPTAGGKTEAAFAPLIERFCLPQQTGGSTRQTGPTLLYLTPTRALVSDQTARLSHPLRELGLTLAIKTGDVSTLRAGRTADVVLTTPESLDSLLTTQARLLINLRAIIIDEIHLFDGTPRGEQLRVLPNRIRRVRAYAYEHGDAPDAQLQYVALSATVQHPQTVAARYFPAATVLTIEGRREMVVEWIALDSDTSAGLLDYLQSFRARGWRKALVFCNSRAEVEAYAAAARKRSPFGDAVYVHYSNIDPKRRREIERQYAEHEVAICFASNTLELGIDVGSIDIVLLIGPPGNLASFTQRVGRGNRRQRSTRVACLYRSRLEQLLFEALTEVTGDRLQIIGETTETLSDDHRPSADDHRLATAPASGYPRPLTTDHLSPFRPAVAVQQIFSLIKQSPLGAVRLSELADLLSGMIAPDDLLAILGQLQVLGYLTQGRPGEWRAGQRLNELFDEQMGPQVARGIFSNVQSAAGRVVAIRDQHTHQTVARVDAQWLDRPVLFLEGRPINVEWWDGEAMWISSHRGQEPAEHLLYRSGRQLLGYDLAQRAALQLGLTPGSAPFIATPTGWSWFHWLGDLYGRACLDLLRAFVPATRSSLPGLCLLTPDEPRALPVWQVEHVVEYLEANYPTYEPMLALGPFQDLLPVYLRQRSVVEQFDVARFMDAVAMIRQCVAPDAIADDLLALLRETD